MNYLEDYGDAEHVRKIAEFIAHTLGSTKKFIDFTSHFMPNEPNERPSEEQQISWKMSELKKILRKIYSYRSRFLHDGIPFPNPMLEHIFNQDSPPEEIPLTYKLLYGTWLKKDIPINLNCFHYITRGVLLNWWKNSLTKS